MISDVIQTSKYGKKMHCKYFNASKYFYAHQMINFRVESRTPENLSLNS